MIDYLRIQKIIHWAMAILIMLDLNIAQKFGGEMELLDRLESRVDHATAGLIVTFLLILRIALRYKYGAPPLPKVVFGSINLSSETNNIDAFNFVRSIHEFATNAIIALIVIHIAAALYHHFVVKDDTTINMTKFWTSKSR